MATLPPWAPFVPRPAIGRLLVLAAALMWSTSGLFAKAPLFADWEPSIRGPLFAFWRAMFAAAVLMPLVRRPRWNPLLVPLAVVFVVMNVTYLTAMVLTTAANAIWLQSTAPWWVFLISIAALREPVARRDFLPLVAAVFGVGTIILFEMQGQARFGVCCGLISGVAFAGVLILMRALRDEDSAWLIALNHATAAAVVLPWVTYVGVWPSFAQLVVIALFGSLQMAVPYMLLIRGLRHIRSHEASAIGLVEPVLLPLWVYLVWLERPAWWTVAGASLIMTGLVLRYVVLDWSALVGDKLTK